MKSPKHALSSPARYRLLVALAALVVLVPAGIAAAVYSGRRAAPDAGRSESTDPGAGDPRPPGSPSLRATEGRRPTGAATASGRPTRSPSASPRPTRSRPPGGPGRWWRPAPGTTWQWQIVGAVREPFADVAMYDIDLTDAVPRDTTVPVPGFGAVRWPKGINAGVVDRLHAAGKVVICYLDTGAYETYEPDARLFPGRPGFSGADAAGDVIGNDTGWDGEYWLDIRRSQWHRFAPIMWARFDLAKAIGCDGVEPDQNNPIGNNPGPPITLADQKAWYLEVARQAHARGLSVGMKNGVEVTDRDTVAAFDWNLNEECFYFDECHIVDQFVKAGKAVFTTEYIHGYWDGKGYASPRALASSDVVCPSARRRGFSTLVKAQVPDASLVPC